MKLIDGALIQFKCYKVSKRGEIVKHRFSFLSIT